MPYKRTGNPPGRPRKPAAVAASELEPGAVAALPADLVAAAGEIACAEDVPAPVRLTRARAAFRRTFPNPADDLHTPPRYGARRRHVGKRPILHPNVIAGGTE